MRTSRIAVLCGLRATNTDRHVIHRLADKLGLLRAYEGGYGNPVDWRPLHVLQILCARQFQEAGIYLTPKIIEAIQSVDDHTEWLMIHHHLGPAFMLHLGPLRELVTRDDICRAASA
jgi:hypothetical protein